MNTLTVTYTHPFNGPCNRNITKINHLSTLCSACDFTGATCSLPHPHTLVHIASRYRKNNCCSCRYNLDVRTVNKLQCTVKTAQFCCYQRTLCMAILAYFFTTKIRELHTKWQFTPDRQQAAAVPTAKGCITAAT